MCVGAVDERNVVEIEGRFHEPGVVDVPGLVCADRRGRWFVVEPFRATEGLTGSVRDPDVAVGIGGGDGVEPGGGRDGVVLADGGSVKQLGDLWWCVPRAGSW